MSLPLAELQRQFSRALHYQASAEECHIVSETFNANERLQIYRNNFIISLSEALAATYPMVFAIVGEECFSQVARQHVLDHPLESGDISEYGEHFCQTIEKFPALIEAAPYSSEVASFEWNIDIAQQLLGHISLSDSLSPLIKLADIVPEQYPAVHLHLSPGVVPFQSSYAVFALKNAIDTNQFEGLQLEQAQHGVICCTEQGTIWTQAIESDSAFELLQHLHSGSTLNEIPPHALEHLNYFVESNLVAGFSLAR